MMLVQNDSYASDDAIIPIFIVLAASDFREYFSSVKSERRHEVS